MTVSIIVMSLISHIEKDCHVDDHTVHVYKIANKIKKCRKNNLQKFLRSLSIFVYFTQTLIKMKSS